MKNYFENFPIEDGMIYINGNQPPAPPSSENNTTHHDSDDNLLTTYTIVNDNSTNNSDGAKSVLFDRVLVDMLDPLTPPKTRTKCVKDCSSDFPPVRFCCGWKTQFKHMYVRYTLRVSVANPMDIKKIVEECLLTGAVVAALSAFATGGSAAIPAAKSAIYACLKAKISSSLLSVEIYTNSRWGSWG